MSKIVVHHLEKSRSTRVLWLLAELGLTFELKTYTRDENFRGPAELRALHPLGKAPLVSLDDVVLAESGAIIETLLDHVADSDLRPKLGTDAHRHYRYFLHYAEGSLMAPLLVKLIVGRLRVAPVPFFVKPVARGIADKIDGNYTDAELNRNFEFLEQHLGENAYFAGEHFSAADIQMSYPIEAGMDRAGLKAPTPNLKAWLDRVRARPAYKTAMEQGGPVA